MSKRANILEAAKELLWDQGFEAMSPKKVMRLSGAGQGSLYHHFEGKEDLALAALADVVEEMKSVIDEMFDPSKAPLDRLYDYLLGQRTELKGCRLGRLVNEKTVLETDIYKVVSDYFEYLSKHLTAALEEAQSEGDLPSHLSATDIAESLQAVIQGGFVLARGTKDPQKMLKTQEGAWAMIEGLSSAR